MFLEFRIVASACDRSHSRGFGRRSLHFLIACCTMLTVSTVCASAAETPFRVFFLESLSSNLPAASRTMEGFRQRLKEKNAAERVEVFVDYMDLVRFPSKFHRDQTAQYLSGKFAEV